MLRESSVKASLTELAEEKSASIQDPQPEKGIRRMYLLLFRTQRSRGGCSTTPKIFSVRATCGFNWRLYDVKERRRPPAEDCALSDICLGWVNGPDGVMRMERSHRRGPKVIEVQAGWRLARQAVR